LEGLTADQGEAADSRKLFADLVEGGGGHISLVEDIGGDAEGALEGAAVSDVHGGSGGHWPGGLPHDPHTTIE
jgi:hypothetical protein